jgi:hypothetical protein
VRGLYYLIDQCREKFSMKQHADLRSSVPSS